MVNVISDNRFFHNRSVSRAGHMTAELGSTGGYSMETGTGVLIGSAATGALSVCIKLICSS